MTVSREDFDALVERVAKLESLSERAWSMIGHLDTSLRQVHAKLDGHDDRFDSLDRRIIELDGKIVAVDGKVESVDRKLDEVLRRLS